MGQSTDAILCWGLKVGGEDEGCPWEDKAREAGFDDPFSDEAFAYFMIGEKYVSWLKAREEMKKVDVELITHCYWDYPMYILAVRASNKTASRGSPESIPDDYLTVPPQWVEAIIEACKKLGIEYESPGWILCSYWC